MKKLVGFLGLMLLMVCAPMAQAALQISYKVGAGPIVTCFGPAPGPVGVCAAVVAAPVSISVLSATSNSPGTAALAQEIGSTLLLTSTAATTLEIWIASTDFALPTTPPNINFASTLTTDSTTGVGTTSLTSCVNTANTLGPPGFAFCGAGPSLTNATQLYGPGASSDAETIFGLITSLGAPYALQQHITITLSAGANLNVTTSTVLTPVPEPMSIALLGGVVLLTGRLIRRRVSHV